MKKLFLTGLAILGLGFVTVPMSVKAQPTTSPTTPSNSTTDNGSTMPSNSTTNNGSTMKKPSSAAKTPRSTIRPRNIVNSRRSHSGGGGGGSK